MSEILTLAEDFGVSVRYKFSNQIERSFKGRDMKNCLWHVPVAEFDLSYGLLEQSDYDYLKGLFNTVGGSRDTFLYFDPLDYDVEFLDTGRGITNEGFLITDGTGNFQMAKRYAINDTFWVYRPVTRPVNGTINFSGTIPTDVDYDTGMVTGGDLTTRWTGQYYTPVRFVNDTFPAKVIARNEDSTVFQRYRVPNLKLIEVREAFLNAVPVLSSSYVHTFALPLELGSDLINNTGTDIYTVESGFEHRDTLSFEKVNIEFSDYLLDDYLELAYLIGLYRVCLGNALIFTYVNVGAGISSLVRFNDVFDIRLLVEVINQDGRYLKAQATNLSFVEDSDLNHTFFADVSLVTQADGGEGAPPPETKGFTNHNGDLLVNAVNCSALVSLNSTNSQRTSELNVDSTEIASVFNALSITEEDLVAGRYKDAGLVKYVYDWLNRIIIATHFNGFLGTYEVGYIGNVGKSYSLETYSASEFLDASISLDTSSECRHIFLSQGPSGFACNRIIDGAVAGNSSVTGVIASNVLQIGTGLDNWVGYRLGILRFTSGVLAGTEIYITDAVGLQVTLLYSPNVPPAIGTSVTLFRGCNKSLDACFGYVNTTHYGGFPRAPGVDLRFANPFSS